MRKFTSCFVLLFILLTQGLQAQTTLNAGDMAFYGMDFTNNKFGFVTFKALEPGTEIYVTDAFWNRDSSNFLHASATNLGEFFFKWTVVKPVPAGTMFYATYAPGYSFSVMSNTDSRNVSGEFSAIKAAGITGDVFVSTGDNLFLYQAPTMDSRTGLQIANPRFIAGMAVPMSNSVNAGSSGWAISYTTGANIASTRPNELTGSAALGFPPTTSGGRNVVWYAGPTNFASAEDWASRFSNTSNYTSSTSGLPVSPINLAGSCTAPVITSQPTDATTPFGYPVTFSVTATGTNLTYQWHGSTNNGASWVNIISTTGFSGFQTNTLTVKSASTSMNGYLFRCEIKSDGCKSTTNAAKLIIGAGNSLPYVSSAGNRAICPGVLNVKTFLAVGDMDNDNISVTATSSDNELFPAGSMLFNNNTSATSNGAPGSRDLTLTPAPNKYGTATITLTPNDGKSNGVPVTFEVTVTNLSSSEQHKNPSCFTSADGNATVTVSGGTAPYTYSWSGLSATTATLTNLSQNVYKCTVKDNNGCSITQTVPLIAPSPVMVAFPSMTLPSCMGQSNGSVTASAMGGSSFGFSYAWSPSGGNQATATGLAAGSYTVTATDMNGCTGTGTISISEPKSLSVDGTQTNVSCNGEATGSASASVSGGFAPYTYNWSPSGGTASTASGLTAGTYTVTATDANGCNGTKTFTISQPAAHSITVNTTSASCNNPKSGAASVSVSGGTSPYTYSWYPTGGATATPTNLQAGIYTVFVTDGNGCYSEKGLTIGTSGTAPALSFSAQTDVSCNSGTNGSATVHVSNATAAPKSFTFNTPTSIPVNGQIDVTIPVSGISGTLPSVLTSLTINLTSSNVDPLDIHVFTPGDQLVTFVRNQDAHPGANFTNTVIGATGSALSSGVAPYTGNFVSDSPINFTGSANGTWKIRVYNNSSTPGGMINSFNLSFTGQEAMTYSWAPSGGSDSTATNLAAGQYTVTVTNTTGCVSTKTVTIAEPKALAATITGSTNISCNGGMNGSATINASGGTAPLTYYWTQSEKFGSTVSGLNAGLHTCIVTDANNCSVSKSVTLTQPAALSFADTKNDVTCQGGNNGEAKVVASGGTSPYTYSWNHDGETKDTAKFLASGDYKCIVTDANYCQTTRTFTIGEASGITATVLTTKVSCNGASDGTAGVGVSGGTPGYSYQWSLNGVDFGDNSSEMGGLKAGTYNVKVTDAASCFKNVEVVIEDKNQINATIAKTDVLCNGQSNGAITVNASGGAGSFSYTWTGVTSTSSNVTGLAKGEYTCHIKDADNCIKDTAITIDQPEKLKVTATGVTNVSCNSGANGSIIIAQVGGTSPYTYSWSNSASQAPMATGLSAVKQVFTVTDANGCTAKDSVTLTEPTALTASTSMSAPTCNGSTDGAVSVTPTGGTGAYTYLWSTMATTPSINTLSAGTYICKITDANSCQISKTVTLIEPTVVAATTNVVNALCYGVGGTGTVTPAGGNGAPYTYLWNDLNSSTTATVNYLKPGNYAITVYDKKLCSTDVYLTVTEPSDLVAAVVSKTNVACNGGSTGSISLNTTGGTGAYSYKWYPSGGTASTATGLAAGTYSVTVTDANGCKDSLFGIQITQPQVLTISDSSKVNVACNGASTGSASVIAAGGTAPYSYEWFPYGGSSNTASALPAGTFAVTVTDANGCTVSKSFTITESTKLEASLDQASNVKCYGEANGNASVTVTGGTGAYSYDWGMVSGGSTDSAYGLTAGTYTCKIKDANDCKTSITVTITQPTLLTTSVTPTHVTCYGLNDGKVITSTSGGTLPYSYSWTNSSLTSADLTDLIPGAISVTVTDANGCTATKGTTITQPDTLKITGISANTSCFGNNDGFYNSTVVGGTLPYTYTVNNDPASDVDKYNIQSGQFLVNVQDANGCKADIFYTISDPAEILIDAQPQNAEACAGSDATTQVFATNAKKFQWQALVGGTYTDILQSNTSYAGANTSKLTIHAVNGLNNTMYRCIVSQSGDCYKITGEVKLIVRENPPKPSITYIPPVCKNEPAFELTQGLPTGGYFTLDGNYVDSIKPAEIPVGTYMLVYGFVNQYGCQTSTFQQLTIKPVTEISFEINDTVCQSNTGITLTGATPTGGIYSGEDVKKGVFTPAIAGDRIVTYSYLNTSKCTSMKSDTIVVLPAPFVPMPKPQSICENAPAINLKNSMKKEKYTISFSGDGVTGDTFDPKGLSVGNHYIKVLAINSNGCFTLDSFLIVIKAKPAVSMEPVGSVCQNAGAVELFASPVGGTFNGDGISNGFFDPTFLSASMYELSYAFTAENGCSDTAKTKVNVLETPEVSIITPKTTFCEGENITLNVGNYTSYQWYLDEAKIVGQSTNKLIATEAGTYTVEVVLQNNCKTTSTPVVLSRDVIIEPIITYVGTPNFCSQSSIELSTQQYETYQWYNNGFPIVGANDQKFDVKTEGTFTVEVTNGVCTSVSLPVTVTGHPPVVISTSRSAAICAGDSVTLTASAAHAYNWMKNGNFIPNATKASYTAGEAGDYSVLVSDTNGCTLTSQPVKVVMNASPTPVIFAVGDTSICPGGSVIFSTYGTYTKYRWTVDQDDVNGGRFQKVEAKKGGAYRVYVYNDAGCAGWSNYIHVVEKSAPDVTLNASGINFICQGNAFKISTTEGMSSYQWFKGSQAMIGEDRFMLNAVDNGSYKVAVENAEGCKAVSGSVTVFTKALPEKPSISLTDSSLTATEAPNYQWYKEGNKIEGATEQVLKIFANGHYTVEVVGSNGCNIFSEDFVVNNLSLDNIVSENKVLVYPNPVSSFVTIEVVSNGSYTLFDVSGKQLSTGNLEEGKNTIQTYELASGVYQLRVSNGREESFIRLVK